MMLARTGPDSGFIVVSPLCLPGLMANCAAGQMGLNERQVADIHDTVAIGVGQIEIIRRADTSPEMRLDQVVVVTVHFPVQVYVARRLHVNGKRLAYLVAYRAGAENGLRRNRQRINRGRQRRASDEQRRSVGENLESIRG